jgi:hypothetical protein
LSRGLIGAGVALIVLGLIWPWIAKIPLGRLPGDITVEKEHFSFFFPITTSILLSLILTLLFWIFRK